MALGSQEIYVAIEVIADRINRGRGEVQGARIRKGLSLFVEDVRLRDPGAR